MQQQFNERERSLHEEMAATRRSAKQVIDQQAGEIQRASAASTDEIRKRRQIEEFAQQLANELKGTRLTKEKALETIRARNREIADMQIKEQDIFTAMMEKEVARNQREKEKRGLNVTNPIVPAPSLQPSGASVPGKERAVQPTTGSNIPANPAPATNSKAREDDKPLNKTVREGGSEPIQKKAQKQTKEAEKQKREDKKDADQQQAKQQKKADPPPPPAPAESKNPVERIKMIKSQRK